MRARSRVFPYTKSGDAVRTLTARLPRGVEPRPGGAHRPERAAPAPRCAAAPPSVLRTVSPSAGRTSTPPSVSMSGPHLESRGRARRRWRARAAPSRGSTRSSDACRTAAMPSSISARRTRRILRPSRAPRRDAGEARLQPRRRRLRARRADLAAAASLASERRRSISRARRDVVGSLRPLLERACLGRADSTIATPRRQPPRAAARTPLAASASSAVSRSLSAICLRAARGSSPRRRIRG